MYNSKFQHTKLEVSLTYIRLTYEHHGTRRGVTTNRNTSLGIERPRHAVAEGEYREEGTVTIIPISESKESQQQLAKTYYTDSEGEVKVCNPYAWRHQ
jgi:hypothetical protein